MEQAAAQWRYDELHKDAPFHDGTFPDDPGDWSPKRTLDTPYHYNDGAVVWVSQYDLTPDAHFLLERSRPGGDDDEPTSSRG